MSREARLFCAALLVASFSALGANYPTQNFVVTAPTPELAREIGDTAEAYRRKLAIAWLGQELPPWSDACPITVQVGPHLGAGGATSFYFRSGRPYGWRMSLQGPREQILESVLPHEIMHTILATHFGQPLPRWADEGVSTLVEHPTERAKQHRMLIDFLTTGRGIAFNRLFAMREYPPDILPLYAHGYSLTKYLVQQGGKRKFVDFVGDGLRSNNWTATTARHYGYKSLRQLQDNWLAWVREGSPAQPSQTFAATEHPQNLSTPAPPAERAQSATAENRVAASGNSWYARQRKEHLRQQQHNSTAQQTPDRSNSVSTPPAGGALTRAPQVERPQPTVLPNHPAAPRATTIQPRQW